MSLTISLALGRDGSPKFFIVAFEDIGDRKAAEQSLQLALEAAAIPEWDHDSTSNVTCRSARFDRLYGYDRPRISWTLEEIVHHAHPEDRDQLSRKFADAFVHLSPLASEHRVIWPDQTTRWMFLRGHVYLDHDGRAVRIAGVVRDITAKKTFANRARTRQGRRGRGQTREIEFFDQHEPRDKNPAGRNRGIFRIGTQSATGFSR